MPPLRKRISLTFRVDVYQEFKKNCIDAGLPKYAPALVLQQMMEQFNADYAKFGYAPQLELFEVKKR